MNSIDNIQVHFSASGQHTLLFVLAFIMFGIALDIDIHNFKTLKSNPKPIIVGLLAHWIVLPLATFVLVNIIQPAPSIALGMFLVAACPSGNMATYIVHLSKGNRELSISISTIIAITCFFTTPFLFFLMAKNYAPVQGILTIIKIDFITLITEIALILCVPILLGLFVKNKFPYFINKIKKTISVFSFLLFVAFLIVAFWLNKNVFIQYLPFIFWIVMLHNAIGFGVGFVSGKIAKLPINDIKTITIECGIQNSGLGLVLIFSFFNGLGGMALVAAWWGIYHIFAGIILSLYFRKK